MRFIAISLRDYHQNKMVDASVNCKTITVGAKSLARAKEIMSTFHPECAWLLARCDTTNNIAYPGDD